ncbi:hypothetical protein QZN11_26955 [Streptomyces gramineus]|uniref:hypothetical protein n=1 Tax=Streptomyces gramineus TaxID=910542 RepID=UPI00398B2EBD
MYMPLRIRRRSLSAVTLALLLASGAVACGGGDESAADKAKGQSDTSQKSASGASDDGADDSGGSSDDDGVAFATCMRKNGVDVPDPRPGEQPRIPDDVARSLVEKAEKACGKAPGSSQQSGGGEFANDPKLEDLALKNTKCLREHGYTAQNTGGGAAAALPGQNPVFDRAKAACKKTGDELTNYINKVMGKK